MEKLKCWDPSIEKTWIPCFTSKFFNSRNRCFCSHIFFQINTRIYRVNILSRTKLIVSSCLFTVMLSVKTSGCGVSCVSALTMTFCSDCWLAALRSTSTRTLPLDRSPSRISTLPYSTHRWTTINEHRTFYINLAYSFYSPTAASRAKKVSGTESCNFATEAIIGAQNFNAAIKFLPKRWF